MTSTPSSLELTDQDKRLLDQALTSASTLVYVPTEHPEAVIAELRDETRTPPLPIVRQAADLIKQQARLLSQREGEIERWEPLRVRLACNGMTPADAEVFIDAQMDRAQAAEAQLSEARAEAERWKTAAEANTEEAADWETRWHAESKRSDSAEARLQQAVELMEALAPIPEALEAIAELPDDMNLYLDGSQCGASWEIGPVTVGNLRALRTTLAAIQGDNHDR